MSHDCTVQKRCMGVEDSVGLNCEDCFIGLKPNGEVVTSLCHSVNVANVDDWYTRTNGMIQCFNSVG